MNAFCYGHILFECISNHIASFLSSFLDTSLNAMYGIIVIKIFFNALPFVNSLGRWRKPGISASNHKNPLWLWGWNRKTFRPVDHWLALQGLPSDGKRWSRGADFYIPPSHVYWILFLAHHCFFYFKINIQKSPNTLKCNFTWWHYFNITMTSLDDHVREFQYNQCM